MTPADAAAPEQSGADPVVTVLLVVPVIVASTEAGSVKSETAAIAVRDLIMMFLPCLQTHKNLMFNERDVLNFRSSEG